MNLIDTHAHLDIPPLHLNTEKIIKNAKDANVSGIITIGVDTQSSKKSLEYARKYQMVFASAGIHPNHSKDVTNEDLDIIKKLSGEDKIVAIGEIGLDYYWNHSPREKQIYVLINQIEIAREKKLPIIVHSRDANFDVYNILMDNARDLRVVFHCFSGDLDFARKILDVGCFISFTGVITFPRAMELREVVKYVPTDRIFIETDCPYLAPVPKRGKTNEPSYLPYILEEIARIKEKDIEDMARCTTSNAKEFFNLKGI